MAAPILQQSVPNSGLLDRLDEHMSGLGSAQAQSFRHLMQDKSQDMVAAMSQGEDVSDSSGGFMSDYLRQLGHDLRLSWQDIQSSIDQASSGSEADLAEARVPSAAELLTVQSRLIKVSFEYEVIGKVISRMTQNIDQLTKLQ